MADWYSVVCTSNHSPLFRWNRCLRDISCRLKAHKNEGDEGGKIFLRKSSNITNASTCVKSHENHQNHGHPCTDPKTERHVTPVDFSAKIMI
ncbi:hypothetical protein ALC56_12453 [Trachymyrmex septentrionalis]|uniref:Uncharacterized protein n=1 Tax=Trachymyrmex septentrionalis TaxID=34720 RepID=A0A195EZJ9_9HYME|nr:hypothetical protein ALC56_12453 [Trachymyrmex septentrionalis]